jgi:hypothetical protein
MTTTMEMMATWQKTWTALALIIRICRTSMTIKRILLARTSAQIVIIITIIMMRITTTIITIIIVLMITSMTRMHLPILISVKIVGRYTWMILPTIKVILSTVLPLILTMRVYIHRLQQ